VLGEGLQKIEDCIPDVKGAYMRFVFCVDKARDARRITAAEMKYMRTAGYTRTDYKTNIKGIKNNIDFRQITGIQEKLDTTCK